MRRDQVIIKNKFLNQSLEIILLQWCAKKMAPVQKKDPCAKK